MVDEVVAGMQAAKAVFETLKSGIGFFQSAVDALPEGEDRTKAEEALKLATEQAEAAKVVLAKEIGFPICKCEFPGVPMLLKDYDKFGQEVFECPECEREYPPKTDPDELTMRIS